MSAPAAARRAALAISGAIDAGNRAIGELLLRLMPAVVVLAVLVVVLRYAFRIGIPWLSESYVWLNGAIFMLGAGYVMLVDGHVRVDVFYRKAGTRGRALIDICGVALLLWPALWIVFTTSLPNVLRSWKSLEGSPTLDGLTFLYLLKTCVPLFCVLLALQGLSLALRSAVSLAGDGIGEGSPEGT